jgi:hypothetical protein
MASPTPPSGVLSIITFGDVYELGERQLEPVGGAARFAHLVERLRAGAVFLVVFERV